MIGGRYPDGILRASRIKGSSAGPRIRLPHRPGSGRRVQIHDRQTFMTVISRHLDLPDTDRLAVHRLAAMAHRSDGVHPLNEAAQLALAGQGTARVVHWLATVADPVAGLVGYAQLDLRDRSVQLVVAPDQRRRGIGRALAERITDTDQPLSWWAFGDLPGARALASALGLAVVRGLLVMRLDLSRSALTAAIPMPDGFVLDHYRSSDLARLVAVNAAAFATHPEQGILTAADFEARMNEPWYRNTDLLVARDARTQELVGYHWTKVEGGEGEVYVIGIDPGLNGRGLGRALLEAGIIHMQNRGASIIDLYVEAANERVVGIYRAAGFEVIHVDVSYGHVKEDW